MVLRPIMTRITTSNGREQYRTPELLLVEVAVESGFTTSYTEDDEEIELS